MAKMLKVLQPEYLKKFQCICGECEDLCCRGWNVHIDENTYNLYENLPDSELKQLMAKHIERNSSASIDYAKIKMGGDGYCPFLTDDKLCSIQRTKGEPYLSIICSKYPRIYNIANNILEKSLSVSCPEAARAALLNPGLMEFEMSTEDERVRKNFNNIVFVNEKNIEDKNKPQRYFSQIRSFVISLLQLREYPLWQRLIILGLFSQALANLIAENKANGILPLITTYLEQMKADGFKQSLENIPAKLTIQFDIIKIIIENRVKFTNFDRYTECLRDALKGINYSPGLPAEELAAQYGFSYKTYYQPFMNRHEYILENYLVNYIFNTLFPFIGVRSAFDNYTVLVIHYAMVKMLCIGMAGFYKENFDAAHVIKVIQSLSKVVTHDNVFLDTIVDFLQSNQLNNMAYMSILIKN